jgi:hypothetical protein
MTKVGHNRYISCIQTLTWVAITLFYNLAYNPIITEYHQEAYKIKYTKKRINNSYQI